MNLESLIAQARELGASDLHLEPGLPVAVRVRGELRIVGEAQPSAVLAELGRTL